MVRKSIYVLLLAGAAILAGAGVASAQEDDQAMACGDGAVSHVADSDHNMTDEWSNEQTVDVDEDDVLLGIALANNGATGVDWQSIRDFTHTSVKFRLESRVADLDRDDVFSALALGVDAKSDSLEALACVSDVTASHRETTTHSRTVDLEEEEVLLAIAMKNAVGGDLDLDDVADISESMRTTSEQSHDVNVDREDTFLALALGAGGDSA